MMRKEVFMRSTIIRLAKNIEGVPYGIIKGEDNVTYYF